MTMKVVSALGGGATYYQLKIIVNAEEEEADVLVDRLDTTTTRYKMVIGPDKSKLMINNSNGFQRETKIDKKSEARVSG